MTNEIFDPKYKKIDRAQFLRELEVRKTHEFVLLLGAGTSVESGVPMAEDLIWTWKKSIYFSAVGGDPKTRDAAEKSEYEEKIQNWIIDKLLGAPILGDPAEYSFYADSIYQSPESMRLFFEDLLKDKTPSIGYIKLCRLIGKGLFRLVFTTNFDALLKKASENESIHVKEVNIDNSKLIHRPTGRFDLTYVELHGDYKYESLKNTVKELDSQSEDFNYALERHLYNKHLMVIGYSGRDKSLMESLEKALTSIGGGNIYWCGYDKNIPNQVDKLLSNIGDGTNKNREAYYIDAGNFENLITEISQFCFEDDPSFQESLNQIKKNRFEWKENVIAKASLVGQWDANNKNDEALIRKYSDEV